MGNANCRVQDLNLGCKVHFLNDDKHYAKKYWKVNISENISIWLMSATLQKKKKKKKKKKEKKKIFPYLLIRLI